METRFCWVGFSYVEVCGYQSLPLGGKFLVCETPERFSGFRKCHIHKVVSTKWVKYQLWVNYAFKVIFKENAWPHILNTFARSLAHLVMLYLLNHSTFTHSVQQQWNPRVDLKLEMFLVVKATPHWFKTRKEEVFTAHTRQVSVWCVTVSKEGKHCLFRICIFLCFSWACDVVSTDRLADKPKHVAKMLPYSNAVSTQVRLDQQCEHCHPATHAPWKLCTEPHRDDR